MVALGVVALAGVIAIVVLLSQGGGSTSKHRARATAAGRRKAKAAGVTRIRPIAVVDDLTSTGQNEDPDSVKVNIYDLRRQGPFVVLDFGIVCPPPMPSDGCNGEFMFGYSTSQGHNSDASEAEAFTTTLGTAGGISLVDPVNDVEYLSVIRQ